ncbi:MAG: SemiSWEET transporter [Candidatus Omnitrophica bacterium]|nr:SemiSWEET transporter [Candidatus Omnitrophota bacterium]
MVWKLIGAIAAILTTFSFVPQIVKVLKTKSVKDVSLIMLLQFSLGVSLWAIYGAYLRDLIIILANVTTFLTLLVLLVLYYKYRRSIK